ncbi:MAG: hypothetical protein WAQ28_08360 [Bacteroidia bacterium]|jgi:hypothetical protein
MNTQTKNAQSYWKQLIAGKMETATALLFAFFIYAGNTNAQTQTYDDFEGKKFVTYGSKNGVLDTAAKNPSSSGVNTSAKCAMYVRNRGKKFDNIKMNVSGNLSDVSSYATYTGIPPKIKLKLYTTAPAGTLVEILLGDKTGNNAYPDGTHSQFQAHTTVSNAWEELEFKFAQIPEGSKTTSTQVNQITLLFNPNSSSSDTYYFDDLSGPAVISGNKTESVSTQVKAEKGGETAK